jgi:hypothetical protein
MRLDAAALAAGLSCASLINGLGRRVRAKFQANLALERAINEDEDEDEDAVGHVVEPSLLYRALARNVLTETEPGKAAGGNVSFINALKFLDKAKAAKARFAIRLQNKAGASAPGPRADCDTPATLSSEVTATLNRLEDADECDDPNQIRVAVQTGRSLMQRIDAEDEEALANLEGGVAQFARVQELVNGLACRVENDVDMQRLLELHGSARVQIKLQRLWDLLAVQTVQAEGTLWNRRVSLDVYRQFHVRLSVVMAEKQSAGSAGGERMADGTFMLGAAAMAEAMDGADDDFAEDIDCYGDGAHVTSWMEQLRSEFRSKCADRAQALGIKAVFQRYDSDCSGALDLVEFVAAVRRDMKVTEGEISGHDLTQLFSAVDTDKSGEVDAEEFVSASQAVHIYGLQT